MTIIPNSCSFSIISGSNGSPSSQDSNRQHPLEIQIGMTIAYVIIFVVSLLGNTALIYVVFKTRQLRTTTNLLLTNMAIADLLITFFAMPYSVIFLFVGSIWFAGKFGDVTCRIVQYILALSIAASILTHVFIALERFFCIVYPFKRVRIIKNSKISYSFIWCSSFFLMSPYLYMYTNLQGPFDEKYYCGIDKDLLKPMKVYFALVFVFLFILPLIFIASLYTLVCRKLWYHKAPGVRSQTAIQSRETRIRKTVKMLVILVIAFAVSWFPAHLMHLLVYSDDIRDFPVSAHLVPFWVCHSHSAINPILVTIFNELYRNACRSIIKRLSSKSEYVETANFRLVSLPKQIDPDIHLQRYIVKDIWREVVQIMANQNWLT